MDLDEQTRDRAKRLYQFVRGLIELRYVPTRRYTSEDVISLQALPPKPDCSFVARGDLPEDDEERWLDVRCPKIEPYPEPPAILRDWLEPSELSDASQDFPNLLSGAHINGEDESSEEGGEGSSEAELGSSVLPSDEPPEEVKSSWEEYVQEQWWPWKEKTAPKYKAKKLYDDLFRMFQRQQQLAETYEIVVGFGTLVWRPEPSVEVSRPLVTTEISLEFDSRRQLISLQPPAEGIRLRLEEDMLDPTRRPADAIRAKAKRDLEELGGAVWGSEQIHDILREYCHGLSSDAQYDPEGGSAPATDSPVVTLSPAIILRKRGSEGLLGLVDSIIEAIADGAEIPPSVVRQVQIVEEERRGTGGSDTVADDDEVYFPLPANREQRKVVDLLRSHAGVVVEGPPGTGKSQSIANLICHLLATGKRVLVTSHTARALQVLRDKLPEDIRPLCVQALSNDAKGMEALEFSVKGITDRHLTWNPEDAAAEIEKLGRELEQSRERQQLALSELRAIRETETYKHEKIAGRYSGTLSSIAKALRSEKSELGFIDDEVDHEADVPCASAEFEALLALLRRQDSWELATGSAAEVPTLDLFASVDNFQTMVMALAQREEEAEDAERQADSSLVSRLRKGVIELIAGACVSCGRRLRYPNRTGTVTCPDCKASFEHQGAEAQRNAIAVAMREFASEMRCFRQQRTEQWLEQAVGEIFADKDRRWKGLLEDTMQRLQSLRSLPVVAIDARISGADSADTDSLRHKATVYLSLLERRRGKPLRTVVLLSGQEKEAHRILAAIKIDGVPGTEPDALEKLRHWCEARRLLALLEEEWTSYDKAPQGGIRRQIEWYEDACEPIQEAFRLYEKAKAISASLWTLLSDSGPKWHQADEIDAYGKAFAAISAWERLEVARAEFSRFEEELRATFGLIPEAHLRESFERAVEAKSLVDYRQCISDLLTARRTWEQEHAASNALNKLRAAAPKLVASLQESPSDDRWTTLLQNWDDAWAWAITRSWVCSLVSSDAEKRATARLQDESVRVQALLEKLAACSAWSYCFERLTAEQRLHLLAWEKAVRRGGKWTGKYASQHRKAAREHLGHCQPAIPAWVMPLYRAADSIRPGPSKFDVAIIDESSQSGPEALVLLFLADKIVVVGDDKQISPDPFTRVEDVNRLREEYIADIPANDALTPENSFFDIARIRYPARVRLVEHFRCMPEIIQFSNDLCYKSEPLIPLRQFGAGRIEPVVSTVHVEGASNKGRTQKTNPKEAAAIARQVAALMKDSRYDGKSFGVISLLGSRQARLIENEIRSLVDARELFARSLICGEAYAFQGDERDVMLLSLVSAPGPDSRIGVLGKAADERRFNVAMSRAKDQVWLFHSATINDLSPSDLRTRLLRYCLNPTRKAETMSGVNIPELAEAARSANRTLDKPPGVFDSWFEVDVFLRIADRGLLIIPQYELHGKFIDMVVVGRAAKLAVECDGEAWHGADEWDKDSSRQRDLERCGLPFLRVRESAFYLDPEEALKPLWETLQRNGIIAQGEPGARPIEYVTEAPDELEKSAAFEPSAPVSEERFGDDGQDPSLPAYVEWEPRPVPDPAEGATRDSLIQALAGIVETEGPVSWRRVFDLYRIGLALGRLKGPRREALESAARVAVRTGRLVELLEVPGEDWMGSFVHIPGGDSVRLRQRGPRDLRDIPPSEIASLISQMGLANARAAKEELSRDHGQEDTSEEWAFRLILACYGLRRLTKGADGGGGALAHLRRAWELAEAASPVEHD